MYYSTEHSKENARKYMKLNRKKMRDRKVLIMDQIKSYFKCSHCPEQDSRCLDFHHLDPKTKLFCISTASVRISTERILEEIKKCIVLCSNCHRKLHHEHI